MAEPPSEDLDTAYTAYLARFDRLFPTQQPGGYVKHRRWLVKRLSREEFAEKLERFVEIEMTCRQIVETVSTISDAAISAYVEAAAHLLRDPTDFLSSPGAR